LLYQTRDKRLLKRLGVDVELLSCSFKQLIQIEIFANPRAEVQVRKGSLYGQGQSGQDRLAFLNRLSRKQQIKRTHVRLIKC